MRFRLLVVVLLGCAANAASAQENLKELVDRAWARAVSVRAAEGRIAEADAGRAQAESLFAGSPALELATRSDRFNNDRGLREHEVALSAPIWLPGQRAAHGKFVDAETAEAAARLNAAHLELAGLVRERVWALVAAEAEYAHAQLHAEAAKRLEADTLRRVKAGDLARTDALLAMQEALNAMAEVQAAKRVRAEAAAKLQALTGSAQLPSVYEEHDVPAPSLEAHPRVLAARLAAERAQRRVRLLSTSRSDAPEVALSHRWEQSVDDPSHERSIGISVRIPLATDARNRPLDAAAQTEVSTTAAEERAAIDQVQADIQSAQAALAAAEEQVSLFEARHAAATERAELLNKSFELGELSLAEQLRARSAAGAAGLARERAYAERGLARARLNQAKGILP